MVTHVSLNSAGYLLVDIQSELIAGWAGDNRLVAEFTEIKENPRVAGTITLRFWALGNSKGVKSRFHFNESTGVWHTSLLCKGLRSKPFGKTIIPDPDVVFDGDSLNLMLPRVTTPLIKKVFNKESITGRSSLDFYLDSKGLRVKGFTSDPKELSRFIDKLASIKSFLERK